MYSIAPIDRAEQQSREDTRTEAFASLNITLLDRSVIHMLEAKVDNGTKGDVLFSRIFQKMIIKNLTEIVYYFLTPHIRKLL